MGTAFKIALRDLRRLVRNPVALLVVGGLLVLPGLYAWYCIVANWDPYANTDKIAIAVVNEDVPASSELTGTVDVGVQVVDKLKSNDSIDWVFEDRAAAQSDLEFGDVYAYLVLPENLSSSVTGIFTGQDVRPTIEYHPNEKYSAVATKVTDSAAQTLQRQVNQSFAANVNEKMVAAAQSAAGKAGAFSERGRARLIADVETVRTRLVSTLEALDDAQATLVERTKDLEAVRGKLDGAGKRLPDVSKVLDTAARRAQELHDGFELGGASDTARTLKGLADAVEGGTAQVKECSELLGQGADALADMKTGIPKAKAFVERVRSGLAEVSDDMTALHGALTLDRLADIMEKDPGEVGEFLSSPVSLDTQEVYPVPDYGTSVAPFYTNLALWVGCFILVSVLKLEADRRKMKGVTSAQAYFGRWILFIVFALLQSQLICGVDLLLGIQCLNPVAFMLAGAFISFVYMNIIFALCITFRNIGKTLCIVLLILQIPGSSGMYPIEIMPDFFQAVHPFLPFTYGIDAMREALSGMYGSAYFLDLCVLLALVPLVLLLGVVCRPYLLNVGELFDAELRAAGFFACEEHGSGRGAGRLREIVRTLAGVQERRAGIQERARRFERAYPRWRLLGTVALAGLPLAFLAVMAPLELSVDARLTCFVVLLAAELLVSFSLIGLEHAHRTVLEELELAGLALDDDARAEATDARGAYAKPSAWAIFSEDVRLGAASVVGIVVIAGLVVVPPMYAWFNIAGSWDPYGNTSGLKVAVASNDEGYRSDLIPVKINIGDAVLAQLRANDSFDWEFVDEAEAVDGINAGRYYASIVIPSGFSASMLTMFSATADPPKIAYYTNEKENPIAPKITQKGADALQEEVRVTLTERIDEVGLSVLKDLLGYLDSDRVRTYAQKASTRVDDAVGDLREGARQLRSVAGLAQSAAELAGASSPALAVGQKTAQSAAGAAKSLRRQLSRIESALEGLLDGGSSELDDAVKQVEKRSDGALSRAVVLAADLKKSAGKLSKDAASLSVKLASLHDDLVAGAKRLDKAASRLKSVKKQLSDALGSERLDNARELLLRNVDDTAALLASPVQLDRQPLFPVRDNGSAMAPFYTVLSLWVGALVLVSTMRVRVGQQRLERLREHGAVKVRHEFFGRFGIFSLIALAQALLVCLGDLLFLHIQCADPVLFVLVGVFVGQVFALIVYTLTALFGDIGKALCIILLIAQVAGSGGTFPVEMLGGIFYDVSAFLPFTYGMTALQECVAGVNPSVLVACVAALAAVIGVMLLAGVIICRPFMKLSAWVDEQLEQTGLM